jgi:ElaB/YqjD/DUF883 family membrane-anchored ribosome-binding protein
MTNNPDEIRREIENTRGRLSSDVNALTETVSPSNVARRQADKVAGVATSVKDRVMGTADDLRSSGSDAASTVGQAPAAAADKARSKTQGNPLAAGLIAFGAGMLVASLLPTTEAESRAGERLAEQADKVVEPLKETGREMGEDLKERAKEAAQEVKSTAQQAVESTKEQAKDSGQQAVQETKDAARS